MVQRKERPGIGGDRTTAGRRFTISGGLNPSDKSTRTIVPGNGFFITVNLDPPVTLKVSNSVLLCKTDDPERNPRYV